MFACLHMCLTIPLREYIHLLSIYILLICLYVWLSVLCFMRLCVIFWTKIKSYFFCRKTFCPYIKGLWLTSMSNVYQSGTRDDHAIAQLTNGMHIMDTSKRGGIRGNPPLNKVEVKVKSGRDKQEGWGDQDSRRRRKCGLYMLDGWDVGWWWDSSKHYEILFILCFFGGEWYVPSI